MSLPVFVMGVTSPEQDASLWLHVHQQKAWSHGNRGDIFDDVYLVFFQCSFWLKVSPDYKLVFSADWKFKLFTQMCKHIPGNIPKIHSCMEVQLRLFKVQNLILCPCFFLWIPEFPGEFPWYFPRFLEEKILHQL